MSVFFSRPLKVSLMTVMGGMNLLRMMILVQSFCSIANTEGFIGVFSKNLRFHSFFFLALPVTMKRLKT